jgi:endonuclease-3
MFYYPRMQFPMLFEQTPLLTRIRARLLAAYGPQRDALRLDPVSQLVNAIISARTRDAVSLAALGRLQQRYPTWEALSRDEPFEIECIILPVTYADAKARFLPRALAQIVARTGALDLGFLADWPVDAALAWLRTLPGVDMRNAATTINFSNLRMRALSVGTHLLRMGQRLGLLARNADFARAYEGYMRLVPAPWDSDDLYEFHWLMKTHGQRVCTHTAPKCADCVLRDLCPRRISAAAQTSRVRTTPAGVARPPRLM